jgi:enoyl-[acyl-carrier protein] reductase III
LARPPCDDAVNPAPPIVLITGASRGIGRATAELFGADGATVYVNYKNNEAAARETVAAIESSGGRAIACQADVEDPEAIEALFERIARAGDGLDVVVANAAATAFKPLLETRPHHLDRTFGLVVRGFVSIARGAVSLMRGRRGSIVAISGLDSFAGFPLHAGLGSAKAALEAMVRYLAIECGPLAIRVNAVNPGFVDTDSTRIYMGPGWPEIRERLGAATPLGRVATPADVARTIRLLCSPDAAWITGQTIVADGGFTLASGIPALIGKA